LHLRLWLLPVHSYIPFPACGEGIDSDNAVLVSELVKVREPRHVVGILIAAMQKNDDRIVLLLVVPFWQMHDELPGDVIDLNLFLGVLRTQRRHE